MIGTGHTKPEKSEFVCSFLWFVWVGWLVGLVCGWPNGWIDGRAEIDGRTEGRTKKVI